jgi:hypothetical protein
MLKTTINLSSFKHETSHFVVSGGVTVSIPDHISGVTVSIPDHISGVTVSIP